MGAPTVTASGERSVAVGGNVYGPIVTGDNVRVVIRDGGSVGTLLDALGLRRRVRTKARPTPLDLRPLPFADCIGREQEAAALLSPHSGRSLNIVGEALVGKTYVLRAALDRLGATPARHGIAVLYGGGRGLDDLLQALWEACFESRPPSVPTRAQVERDLADRELLVVVDSAEIEHDDAQALSAALPRSRLVLVSRERRWHDGDELAVLGLGEEDALALLERELGDPLSGSERDAGVAICRALGGHPVRIRRAAALVRSGGATLAGLTADLEGPEPARLSASTAASDDERDVLAALAPFEGEPVGAGLLEAIAGPGSTGRAAELVGRSLLVADGPRYALPADIAKTLDGELVERAEARTVDRLAGLATERPDELADDLPALLALLDRLSRLGRHGDVVELGRAIAPLLVRARRLGAWGTAAAAVRTASQAVDDPDAEAWAVHELGTHAVARDDVHGGRELLEEALERRARLGDAAGAAASRQNLRALRPPWYLAHVAQLPVIALLVIAVVLIGAGGVGAAWLVTRDDDDVHVTVTTGTETGETTTNGTTTQETTTGTTQPEVVLVEVEPTGGGTGTVTSEPGGITCPAACAIPFAVGTMLVLSAAADESVVLADWGHEQCADPRRPCALELVEPTTVAPRFEPAVSLTVGVSGSAGSVAIEPPGSECEATCTETLAQGTEVTLTAAERDGSAFLRWSGSQCEPATTCSFVLDSPAKVAATFAGPHTLTAAVEGPTGNRVTSSPAGIDCPNACTAPFRHGATVTLTPVESGDGSFFLFWTGDCTGNGSCVLMLERPASVSARFNPPVD